MSAIGHNNPPPDRSFKRRWAAAIFDCPDSKKPVGAVAMAFRLYHDMDSAGRGVALADLEIADACGVSDRSVRTFKGWLVKAGFVKVLARGGRGGQTEYQACIPDDIQPAKSAGQIDNQPEMVAGQMPIQPATISGNKQLNRQSIPAIENELPAKISGQIIQPADFAGQIASSRAVVINNNINNNNNLDITNHTLTNLEPARDGEIAYANNLLVNCETIRHPDFSISVSAIHLGFKAGALDYEDVKRRCLAHAMQWAEEIANGQSPSKVVPSKIGNFLIRTINNDINAEACGEVRMAKAIEGPTRRGRPGPSGRQESDIERTARLMGISRNEH